MKLMIWPADGDDTLFFRAEVDDFVIEQIRDLGRIHDDAKKRNIMLADVSAYVKGASSLVAGSIWRTEVPEVEEGKRIQEELEDLHERAQVSEHGVLLIDEGEYPDPDGFFDVGDMVHLKMYDRGYGCLEAYWGDDLITSEAHYLDEVLGLEPVA